MAGDRVVVLRRVGPRLVEGGEDEVARDDGDEDVGVESGDADRAHP